VSADRYDLVSGLGEHVGTLDHNHLTSPEPCEVCADFRSDEGPSSVVLTRLPDEGRDLIIEVLERIARVECCWPENEALVAALRGSTIWIEEK
jgi:hypothetical protein